MDNEAVPVERISTLVRNRCCTRILLLISRIWDAMITGRNGDFGGVDAIGIDEEGNAIHIVIDRSIAASLRDILKEGEVYIFSNIGCIPATNYRPVMRPERLRFNSATQVQVHENFTGEITRHFFEFQSFATAATRLKKDTFLTDLIGVITKIEDPSGGYTKHGEGTRSKLYIQDLSGAEFPINLWNDLSHQFRSHQLLECKETTIIIVCALAIRIYNGEIHGSSMSASKFYLNLDVPEVAEYLERYGPLNIVPQLLATNQSNSTMQMVVQEPVQTRTVEDFLNAPSSHVKPGQKYNCVATVISFNVDNGWFYTACKKCTRKLPAPETNMGCQNCSLKQSDSMPWYRLLTQVQDCSGDATFMIFGRSGDKLIGAPVTLLASAPMMDPQVIPPLMERAIGKTRIFQIQVKENTFGEGAAQLIVQNIFDLSDIKPKKEEKIVEIETGNPDTASSSYKKRVLPLAYEPNHNNPMSAKKNMDSSQEQLALLKGKLAVNEEENSVSAMKNEELSNNSVVGAKVKAEVVVGEAALKPVLKTLQTPLFDKLDSTIEVDLKKDLCAHLIAEEPPKSSFKKTKEKKNNVRGVKKVEDLIGEDDKPLIQMFKESKAKLKVKMETEGTPHKKISGKTQKKSRGKGMFTAN